MPSFPTQLALSALVMGGVVAGLYLLGQSSHGQSPDSAPSAAPTSPTAGRSPLPKSTFEARALLPARSWLVVDFDGRLTGTLPFSGEHGCAQVSAPARVGLAIVGASPEHTPPGTQAHVQPSVPASDGVALLLGSPDVSAEFWRCVRAEVLAAGGRVLGTKDGQGQETLESPSGVLSHKQGRLLFASDRRLEAEVIRLAGGQDESAAAAPPHATLAARVSAPHEGPKATAAPLLATLELPPNWLAGVGPEAQQSPLRHLTAGALRADTDGGASGTLECHEPGCDELAAFLLRARTDLAAALPGPLGLATERSWMASREPHPQAGKGLVRLRWVPGEVAFADWVSGVWRIALAGGTATGETGAPEADGPAKP